MRIVSFVAKDSGGGGRAALRLHTGLRRLHQDAVLYMPADQFSDPNTVLFEPKGDPLSRARRWMRRRLLEQGSRRTSEMVMRKHGVYFGDGRCRFGGESLEQMPAAEAVIAHCYYDFCDPDLVFSAITQKTGVVCVLHTQGLFTGGCGYTGQCSRYESACGMCPQLDSKSPSDFSNEIWRRRSKALAVAPPGRLHFVSGSQWMAESARKSSLIGKFPISVIPYGLDVSEFAPRSRSVAREMLDVPADARIVLFITASSVDYKRKGLPLLIEALKGLHSVPNLFLLTLGKGKLPADLPFPSRHLGSLSHERMLSYVYSAADVLAVPSLEEAFGIVITESMACGTPVVGFNVGGIPDLIRPGVSGLLAPVGDATALKDALLALLSDSTLRREMGGHCREIALAEYSLETYAQSYMRLCESVAGK